MKLACALLVVASMTGCGGTVILQSRDQTREPRPAPMPAPSHVRVDVGREEAVQIVVTEAGRQRVVRVRVDEVKRHKSEWRVELSGTDACGERVGIRARVDRHNGVLKSYAVESRRRGHHGHEGDDDDDDGHHHDKRHHHDD